MVLFVFFGHAELPGLELGDLARDFVIQNWTVDDGLPQNSIVSIAQTPDGYLWFGTYNGLVRFDGVRFTIFDTSNTPEIASNAVYGMHLTKDGRLCLIFEGGDLVVLKDGRFTLLNGLRGLPRGPLALFGESPEGRMEISEDRSGGDHFAEAATEEFKKLTLDAPSQIIPEDEFNSDTLGRAWSRHSGRWGHPSGRALESLLRESAKREVSLRTTYPSKNGGVWVIFNHGIYLHQAGRWTRRFDTPEIIGDCTAATEDSRGDLWISTWGQGLLRYDVQGHLHIYQLDRNAKSEPVRYVSEDREGNVWVGTEASGVFRLRPRQFHSFGASDGMKGTELVKAVTMDANQTLWIITPGSLMSLDTPDRTASIKLHFEHDLGWSLGRDSSGSVLMGDYGGSVFKWSGQSATRTNKIHLAHVAILSVFCDLGGGKTLVGGAKGLWQIEGTNWAHVDLPTDATGSDVRAIARDSEGRTWLGLNGGGLLCNDGADWRVVSAVGPPPLRRILSLCARTNGDLWIGSSGNGLYRLNRGTWFHFDSESTGLPRCVGSLAEDRSGNLWIASTEGIFRARLVELDAIANGERTEMITSRFTRIDGMGSTECSTGTSPGIVEGLDGRLWFATRKGVTVVDPAKLPVTVVPPPIFVENTQLWGDKKRDVAAPRIMGGANKSPSIIEAPADTKLVEIHYTAPGLSAPERVRFRYRLDGVDSDWVDAGTRRVAYFQGLSPGPYRFRVTARSHESGWNPMEGVLTFSIAPHYWQTWWFHLLVTLAAAGLILLIYQLRVARIKAVTRLRIRLAGDLHDEIGANLGSIGLNAEILGREAGISQKLHEELSAIQRLAGQTAQSLRDLVWFTNPDFDTVGNMQSRMRDVAGLLLAGRNWKYDGTATVPARILDPEFRRNVFLIYKEALHNVAKHSGAQNVLIGFHDLENGIELNIEDDGRGLPPDRIGTGNGMKSMSRRTRELGGTIEITSPTGRGVSLRLRIPYRKQASRWLPLLPENSGDENPG